MIYINPNGRKGYKRLVTRRRSNKLSPITSPSAPSNGQQIAARAATQASLASMWLVREDRTQYIHNSHIFFLGSCWFYIPIMLLELLSSQCKQIAF